MTDPAVAAVPGIVELVDIKVLRGGLSPRISGISRSHAQLLGEVADELPPIVVQRSSMRVVDGMHRLHVARSRGDRMVPVVYFEGSDDEAFLAAIQLNAVHGMPLSRSDRATAVARILASHPHWSDRRIGSACGVAPKTVATLRHCSIDDGTQLNTRVGRDGRRYSISTDEGRRRATEIMRQRPETSLREIARATGISVGTAMNVRRQLAASGTAPRNDLTQSVTAKGCGPHSSTDGRVRPTSAASSTGVPQAGADGSLLLEQIIRDPSLRYTERGRALLRLVSATLTFMKQSDMFADDVPGHCRRSLRTIAEGCASGWQNFGLRLARVEPAGPLSPAPPELNSIPC